MRETILPFTPGEAQVFIFATAGWSNKDIARELSLSIGTVKHRMTTILRLTGCRNRHQLALKYK